MLVQNYPGSDVVWYVDDDWTFVPEFSSDNTWELFEVSLEPGPHRVTWEFQYNPQELPAPPEGGFAYLDDVYFTPGATSPTPVPTPAPALSSNAVAYYDLILEETCLAEDPNCAETLATTTMYEDVASHFAQAISDGGFTATLRDVARECGTPSCAGIEVATIVGGALGEEVEITIVVPGEETGGPTQSPAGATPAPSLAPT